jgi:hypothetical protein
MSNPFSKRAISDYVETQARDETVQHAERIMSEHVVDDHYDCWDVHTDNVRAHLKAISKSAWDLANWLTHQSGARGMMRRLFLMLHRPSSARSVWL